MNQFIYFPPLAWTSSLTLIVAKWSIPGSKPISFNIMIPFYIHYYSNALISGNVYWEVTIDFPISAHIFAIGIINWGGI